MLRNKGFKGAKMGLSLILYISKITILLKRVIEQKLLGVMLLTKFNFHLFHLTAPLRSYGVGP